MSGVWKRQSELSLASVIFYAAGSLMAVLSVTLFFRPDNPLNAVNLATAFVSLLVALVFLLVGRRTRTPIAIAVLCLAALLMLAFSAQSVDPLRFLNTGLLFYTFIIYLVWFGSIWLARVFGVLWLVAYWVIAVIKFGDDMSPLLVTLTITSVVLGELIGLFRRRLETSSLTDALCGVWNQRGLQRLLPGAIRGAGRSGDPLALLFLDLDDFKAVNDTRGHAEGDRVLRAFAVEVEHFSRPGDTLARVGGDEFVLVMPGVDAEQAEAVAQRLQREVTAAVWSYGIAEWVRGERADDLLGRADELMLQRKAARKATRRSRGGEA